MVEAWNAILVERDVSGIKFISDRGGIRVLCETSFYVRPTELCLLEKFEPLESLRMLFYGGHMASANPEFWLPLIKSLVSKK